MIALALAAASLLAVAPADAALDSLADVTAREAARFADRRVAIAEGYRRIGTDFAAMGEHWIHPGALLANRVEARRPTMLTYADVRGTPTLLGVGFVVTTRGDETAAVPGWPSHWHEHSGLLADESSAGRASRPAAGSATHVWVLHIWTALPNPGGRYDADNWALPFARLALEAAPTVDHASGSAAALTVADGDKQLRALLEDAGLRTPARAAAIDDAIARSAATARGVLARAAPHGRVSAAEDAELRAAWEWLVTTLRTTIGPEVEPLLRPAPAHHHEPQDAAAGTVAAPR